MKGKLLIIALALAVGIGAGSYYFLTKGKTNTPTNNVTVTENKDDSNEETKPVDNKETSTEEKPTETSNKVANPELEKQTKLVNSDIEKIKSVFSSNSIKANAAGDISKDSKVTLSGSNSKISKIEYVGEIKDGKLSRNFTIALKHSTTEEFDITKYAPAKALIEAVTASPLDDFEFSDGLTERMTTTRDSKMSYDFVTGGSYKISVNINKNANETISINVVLN